MNTLQNKILVVVTNTLGAVVVWPTLPVLSVFLGAVALANLLVLKSEAV